MPPLRTTALPMKGSQPRMIRPESTAPSTPPIFDGHNDTILRMIRGEVTPEALVAGLDSGHIDLPRARAGGFGGGFFAIFVPSPADKQERYE